MMKKYKFGLILLFGLFWIISFCSAANPITYNFDSPIVSSSTQFYFSSANNINYFLSNITHNSEKYFCVSNLYYAGLSEIIESYIGDLTFYNCPNYISDLTVDIDNYDCYKLQTSYGTTDRYAYESTGYNCYQLQRADNSDSTYIYVSRSLNGGTSSSYRRATVYDSIIDFSTLTSNRQLFNQNFCTSNNLCPTCPTCPNQYTSLECQSEYSLIPISSVDENYCLDNNLCSSSTGNVSRSALYINNIQHLSSPIISVDIPDEISWDYSVENDRFNLDIEGYNVDSDYIDGIINLQKSTPNNQDFNNIITNIIPLLVPGLVIILFIIFIFRFIKKIF